MLLWPPWRFGSNVRNANDNALDSFSDGAVVCEWLFAGLVIAGVLSEFAIAAHHPPYDSWLGQWGSAYADLLVAVGVAGEVFAGVLAHIVQGELSRRSNERVAQLEFESGFANERTAKAERDAADARERTAKIELLTQRRHVSAEQKESLLDAVKSVTAEIDLLIEYQRDDSDAYIYAHEWATAFRESGVVKIRIWANSYLSGNVFGLNVFADGIDIDEGLITRALSEPLFPAAGFHRRDLSTHLSREHTPPNLYMFVAPKYPPEWAVPNVEDPSKDANGEAGRE